MNKGKYTMQRYVEEGVLSVFGKVYEAYMDSRPLVKNSHKVMEQICEDAKSANRLGCNISIGELESKITRACMRMEK